MFGLSSYSFLQESVSWLHCGVHIVPMHAYCAVCGFFGLFQCGCKYVLEPLRNHLQCHLLFQEERNQILADRRKKRAEARRISRAKLKLESPDLYQEQLKANAEATRRKRMERRQKTESPAQASQEDSEPHGKVKRKRADETPEEREARLKAQAEAARIKRQNETPEQRLARNRASAEARRKRYMKETPEQRQQRLFFQAIKARKTRQRKALQLRSPMSLDDTLLTDESLDGKTESEMAEAVRLQRQNETPEQAGVRKRAETERKKTNHQNETPEQREARLLYEVNREKYANLPKSFQSDGSFSQDASSDTNSMEDGMSISTVKTHAKPAKTFACEECGAVFDNSKSLTTHTYIHTGHCPPDRTFACRFCGAGFSDSLTLNDHLQDNHRGVCPFLCEVCGRAFYHNESLKVHLRRHSGHRPYACHVCAASFTSAGSLQNHVRIHTGERPYSCSVCQATFRHNCALTGHMRSHTNERPYSCPDCESTFKHLGKLLAHRKRNHLRGPSTPQPGRRPILRVFEDPLFEQELQ